MPLPLLPLAMIAGALVSGGGIYAGSRQNKKNAQYQRDQALADKDFSREMYERQRQDALSDFDMTNSYNSPLQQMQRLREAGLNPHLVYGKGADNTAAMVRSSSASGSDASPFKGDSSYIGRSLTDGLQSVNTVLNSKAIQAQTDNLHAQNALTVAQTGKTLQDKATSEFELAKAKEIKDYAVDLAKFNTRNAYLEGGKIQADTAFTIDSNQRAELANSSNIAKTSQDIVESQMRTLKTQLEAAKIPAEADKIRAEIANLEQLNANLQKEEVIKDIQIQVDELKAQMLKDGISPNSKTWELTIYKLWEKITKSLR